MKTVLKVVGGLVLLLVALVGGFIAYVSLTWKKDFSAVPKPAIQASTDPEVIRRGEYLAHSVAHCSVCHAPEEVTMKRQPGEHPAMEGGYVWKMGPLGTLHSRNITPDVQTGIGSWTDEELARAIKSAVGKDGEPLVFMALALPAMADEDVQAIVSYLRTTQPVKRQNTPHDPGLVLKWLASKITPDFRSSLLGDPTYVPAAEEPSVKRGEYLARGPAYCIGCHSPMDMMELKLSGPAFSGSPSGEPDKDNPEMVFRPPNLTPDPDTGHITQWTEDQFLARLKAGPVIRSSIMPWVAYREMTDSDLRSVYRFLRTLPPAKQYIGPSHRPASEDPAKDEAAPKSASL